MMQPAIIRITEVEYGDENAPVSFAAQDAVSVVHFEPRSGESPVSGHGCFLTLERVPYIASYETDE